MNASPLRFYEFGPFRIDTTKRLLLRNGEPVALKAKCFETLLVLVEARGRVLDKDELMRRIWPDTIVEESNLTVYISTLRRALGENHRDHRYIVTVPGRGYSFVAQVKEVREESAELVLPEQSGLSMDVDDEEMERLPERPSHSFQPLSRLSVLPSFSRQRPGIVAGAALSILATIIIAAVVLLYFSSSKSEKTIHSTAILPFTIDGNDPDTEYLAEGIANDVANRLSRLPELTVISSNAVARYKAHGAAPDAQAVGSEFKVEAVAVGNVTRQGDHIHIKVELIDARNNGHLWGKLYDRKLTDIFEALEEIAGEISSILRPGLTEKERLIPAKPGAETPEALQKYIEGRQYWNKRTREGLKKAIELFDQAISLDPNCALAYAGLADSYQMLAFHGALAPMEYFPMAKAKAARAIEIDNDLAEAHTSLAYMKYLYDWDWAGADAEFRRAIKLNPNYATAHQWYGEYLGQMGRFDDALAERQRALRLDPLSPIITSEQGLSYVEAPMGARRYDRAIEEFRKAAELYPDFSPAHDFLAFALGLNGLYDEAIAESQKAISLANANDGNNFSLLAIIYARSGRRMEAQKLLTEMASNSENKYYAPAHIAAVYAALGDKDMAFQWLEKAHQQKDWAMVQIKIDPIFDSLRSDPRFSDLLKRMNLQ